MSGSGERRSGAFGWRVVAAGMFCCGWAGNQFTPLLVMYRRVGGYSPLTVDAMLGAYVLGLVPGLLIGGPASDRYGRRPLMLGGTALSAVACAVLAAGPLGVGPIFLGRMLTGVAVGVAMAVGTSWVKELSGAPFEPDASPGAGARRASLALTAGFAMGAGVAGALAQWAPAPMVLPYLPPIVLSLSVVALLPRVPQLPPGRIEGPLWRDLRVPTAGHRRFVRVVLPTAPWIFGAAGIAYAITPQLEADRMGDWQLVYATALTVLTLGTGVAVQPIAKRLDSVSTARGAMAALGLVALGTLMCALNAGPRSPWAGLAVAIVLGAGYSIGLVSGLLEIQRIATGRDLAGLTGVFYALSYVGFLLPATLALLSDAVSYSVLLFLVAVVVLVCLGVVATNSRRHLPQRSGARHAALRADVQA
ncbi:MFS transporter [Actinomadura rupiterrae]|uniref:MFS transporter n=1 Tax=Actinomadura rupiterrae TaxID=559627 RepID=UPI0020A51253|nr:MFS transporter [Actinomadura rupiterrae]MCP2340479.1 MFS family permease [Actinomadura rupiterrae]